MKITAFNPLIVTASSEATRALFEELGFEKTHTKDVEINDGDVSTVRMKDPNGFHVDVSQVPVPQDMTIIRMNVDDFEEAKAILERHGFVNRNAGQRVDSGSSISEFMVSPAGLSINLVKHIKKED